VIGGLTRLVGLLRDPATVSLSPRMQNAAFAARGLDWAYVTLPVKAADLEAGVAGLVALGFAGANVTIPHKLGVVAFCDELDPVAERAGSVNTLVIRDGRVHGSSTDGLAVVESVEPEGAHVLMLGAGGAAQAVACALAEAGVASIAVAGRSVERAGGLAARLRSVYPGLAVELAETWPPSTEGADLIVQATPVKDDPLVELAAHQQAVDMGYLPEGGDTGFLAAARAAGCRRIVDGRELLARQGAASFERWTGVEAPLDVMLAAVAQ
jgi:shikimate dehydrogenase